MRTQAEWKVDTHIALMTGPTRWRSRSCISRAALLVKVMASTEVGGTRFSFIRGGRPWGANRGVADPRAPAHDQRRPLGAQPGQPLSVVQPVQQVGGRARSFLRRRRRVHARSIRAV